VSAETIRGNEIQIRRNNNQIGGNKNQATRNKNQAQRNKNQIDFSSADPDFSMACATNRAVAPARLAPRRCSPWPKLKGSHPSTCF
jgi:hypothetical protein